MSRTRGWCWSHCSDAKTGSLDGSSSPVKDDAGFDSGKRNITSRSAMAASPDPTKNGRESESVESSPPINGPMMTPMPAIAPSCPMPLLFSFCGVLSPMYAMAVGMVAEERMPESERAIKSMAKLCARPNRKRVDGVTEHADGEDGFAPVTVGGDAPDRRADQLHERVSGHQPAEFGAAHAEVFDVEWQERHGKRIAQHDHEHRERKDEKIFAVEMCSWCDQSLCLTPAWDESREYQQIEQCSKQYAACISKDIKRIECASEDGATKILGCFHETAKTKYRTGAKEWLSELFCFGTGSSAKTKPSAEGYLSDSRSQRRETVLDNFHL